MKKPTVVPKTISIVCCIVALLAALYGLMLGLGSIGASGWGALGVIFILPSIAALIIIVFDLLIAIDKIKKGLSFSYHSSIIKIWIIIPIIKSTIFDFGYEMQYGVSNLSFDITLIVLLAIATVPSILNIIKLSKQNNKQPKNAKNKKWSR